MKERKEPSPTPMHQLASKTSNPNAPIGLQDIQPQCTNWLPRHPTPKPRTQAKTMLPPHRPLEPPPPWTTPHTQSHKTMKKQRPNTPESLPNLPRAAQAPGTQQRTPVQPPNLTTMASRTRIIKPSFKHKEQFFSDNKQSPPPTSH